jgi:hypothetical protein
MGELDPSGLSGGSVWLVLLFSGLPAILFTAPLFFFRTAWVIAPEA